jgi:hypothetical protein
MIARMGLGTLLGVALLAAGCTKQHADTCAGGRCGQGHGTVAAKPADAGAKLAVAQTTCPVMEGSPIDRSLFVDHDGKRIYLCCGGCIAVVKKDPQTYIKKLEDAGVALEKTPAAAAD